MRRITFKGFNEPKAIDENGKEVISFKKSVGLPTRSCYAVMNANHEKVGKIEKINNNFAPYGLFNLSRIVISLGDDKITLQKDIKELKDVYEIMGNDFSIKGNWKGSHIDILKKETVVASVNIQKEEIKRTFLIDILDESNEEQVMCILFALSWII